MTKKQDGIFAPETPSSPSNKTTQAAPKNEANQFRKPKRRISYPILKDILFYIVIPAGLLLEMFAPREYRPSTWIGTKLGQQEEAFLEAATPPRIEAEIEKIEATRGPIIETSTQKMAAEADVQLTAKSRETTVLAGLDQQIKKSNDCILQIQQKAREKEMQCMSDENISYGHCMMTVEQMRNMQCPALPSPDDFPKELQTSVLERINAAKTFQSNAGSNNKTGRN